MLLRQRYLDLIYSDAVLPRSSSARRSSIRSASTLRAQNYLEVETPALQAIAGGAAARPFITHHNTLDIDAVSAHRAWSCISSGCWSAAWSGSSRSAASSATRGSARHNPEFTMMELYQAYGDYETMMDLTEADRRRCRRRPSAKRRRCPWGDATIDFTPALAAAQVRRPVPTSMSAVACDDAEAVARDGRASSGFETAGKHRDVVVSEVFEDAGRAQAGRARCSSSTTRPRSAR